MCVWTEVYKSCFIFPYANVLSSTLPPLTRKFSGASVIGLNNNAYQVKRNNLLNQRLGLANISKAVQGDFHRMPFPENSFDKAYAIEATCHAQKLEDPYGQVFKTLKPGGIFCGYEWLTTAKYNENDPEHKRIMLGLEVKCVCMGGEVGVPFSECDVHLFLSPSILLLFFFLFLGRKLLPQAR